MNRFGFYEDHETTNPTPLPTRSRRSRLKPIAQIRHEMAEARRKKILAWLFSEPEEGPSGPSFVGLLACRDLDPLGPDTPLDERGRTAAHYFCDTSAWENLNETQTARLLSIDLLGDLVHTGISWHTPDADGKTPWDLAPHWLKRCIQLEVARRNRMLKQLNEKKDSQ